MKPNFHIPGEDLVPAILIRQGPGHRSSDRPQGLSCRLRVFHARFLTPLGYDLSRDGLHGHSGGFENPIGPR